MTAARLIEPGATYAICRRVEGRRFLLRPDAKLTQLFTWLLCVMARRFDMQVHVAVVMSTHFHLVVTDPHGHVSRFMQGLNGFLSKAIKVLRRCAHGVVWEPDKLSIVRLTTLEAVVEAIVYAIVNPVKAGLVYRPSDWCGLTATIEQLGVHQLEADRPGFYFRNRRKWPGTARLKLTLPPCLTELGLERVQRVRFHSHLRRH